MAEGEIQTGPFGSQLHAHDYVVDGPVAVVPTSAIGRRRLLPEQVVRIGTQKAEELARHRLLAGDIVFARRGVQAAGLSALVEDQHEGWLCGTGGIRLRLPSSVVNPAFLSFALATDASYNWIRQHAVGATMPNLNEGVVRRIPVSLPPLDEQRRIAAVLGALDDKIELNRQMNRTLEEMAQALFKSWFIDFDGHDDLVESELGLVPRGWDLVALGDHVKLDRGLSYKGKHLVDAGTPMVNLKCVLPHGGFRHDGVKFYNGDYKPRHVVRPGDMVIANTDLTQARDILGCPAFVPRIPTAGDIITSHHTYAVRFHDGKALPVHFLYYSLLSSPMRQRCRGFATGTTVLAVKKDVFDNAPFLRPPADVMNRFDEIAGSLHARIDANVEEAATLGELRDTLLPKLVSGEVRVPEAEAVVGDVA